MTHIRLCVILFSTTLWLVQAHNLLEWQSGDNGTVQWAPNCDYSGNVFKTVFTQDFQCGGFCQRYEGCYRFTWTPENGGTCRFIERDGKLSTVQNSGVCGYVHIKDRPVSHDGTRQWYSGNDGRLMWAQNCDPAGNDIGNHRSADFECGQLCLTTLGCTRFAWTPENDGTCYLKSGFGKFDVFTVQNHGNCGYVINGGKVSDRLIQSL